MLFKFDWFLANYFFGITSKKIWAILKFKSFFKLTGVEKKPGNSHILCFVFRLVCVSYIYYTNIIITHNASSFSLLSSICRESLFPNNLPLAPSIVCFRKGLWSLTTSLTLLAATVTCLSSPSTSTTVCE